MSEKILILGSSGKVGSDLYTLFATDFDVVGTYLNNKKSELTNYRLDLSNIYSLNETIEKLQPDFVINATGIASPEECEQDKKTAYLVNYKAAENVAIVCSERKIPFVYFSTDYIFPGDKKNYSEEDIPNPVNYYGLTKLLGEVASREGIILRLPKVILLNKFRDSFFREIMDKDLLQLDNFRIRKFIWTYDLYKVIKKIIGLEINKGLYHVCGDESLTKYQLAKLFLDIEQLYREINPIKKKEIVWRPKMAVMINKKIKTLGVKFTSLEEIFKSKTFRSTEI